MSSHTRSYNKNGEILSKLDEELAKFNSIEEQNTIMLLRKKSGLNNLEKPKTQVKFSKNIHYLDKK
jgi:hypothetical protein